MNITLNATITAYPLNISVATLSTLDTVHQASTQQRTLLAELLTELKDYELGRARALWRAVAKINHDGDLSRGVASRLIARTIEELRVHRAVHQGLDSEASKSDSAYAVPDGRYAVRGEDGVVRFYRLATRTSGKGKGYQNIYVYASDEQHQVPLKAHGAIRKQIIFAGIDASATLFGTELGSCYRCGRSLTDETSRARGIGPECLKAKR